MKPGSGREGGSAGDEPHGNAGLVGCEVREPAAIGMDMTWCNGRLLVEILNCRDGFFTCTSDLVLAVGQITESYPESTNPYRIIPLITESYPYTKSHPNLRYDSVICPLAVDDPRRSESPDSGIEALTLHSEGSPVAGTPRTIF